MIDEIEDEPTSRKRKVQHIGEIYDHAVEFQNSVSNLWTLDEKTLRRIDDLQEQLISEIYGFAPEETINLRAMMQTLLINHHTCLIQVSNKTRVLVFREFLRRVLRILKDYK